MTGILKHRSLQIPPIHLRRSNEKDGGHVGVRRSIIRIALWIVAVGACVLTRNDAYCRPARIRRRARMNPKARSLVLTESQAACLAALRDRKESKTEIAIEAELDLKKTATALEKLEELGLAGRGEMN